MYKTKTLIIGASFLGVGYAAANQDCIIIEKGENPVPDFVGCASLNKINADKAYSPSGKALLSQLKHRKLIDNNGNVHIYPVSGVMSDFILSKKPWDFSSVELEDYVKFLSDRVETLYERYKSQELLDCIKCGNENKKIITKEYMDLLDYCREKYLNNK